MKLVPYIFYYGRCEEALEFYKSVLGGNYEAMRNSDSPMADKIPAEFKNKIMHSAFTSGDLTFLASDGMGQKTIDPEEGERIFNGLAAGGKVKMPFTEAFWGGHLGALDDRFGVEWMVSRMQR
jgi:PhnB protein